MYKFITKYSEFILNETLKTHDIDLTIDNIKTELSLMRFDFNINKKANNTITLSLNSFNYIKGINTHIDVLNNLFIDRHGWFPSIMKIIYSSGLERIYPYDEDYIRDRNKNTYIDTLIITYEPKYNKEIITPEKIYHLSIQEYENKILKNGLSPKSKSKLSKQLDGIYVCDNIDDCYKLINKMKLYFFDIKQNNKKNKINSKWIIYEIDTTDNITLYKDPNYNGGYYTIDNIHPQNIKIADRED